MCSMRGGRKKVKQPGSAFGRAALLGNGQDHVESVSDPKLLTDTARNLQPSHTVCPFEFQDIPSTQAHTIFQKCGT